MTQFTLLALVLGFGSILGQDEVTIDLGKIRGKSYTTRKGRAVSGYLGIPYAKPPIGPLRFAAPERNTDKFDDVFMADTDGNMCPQMDNNGNVVGDEDCLYLNVFTPTESSGTPLATMVYFHRGGFVRGSANSEDLGPEYLLDRDVVLVTVNYRLGALGFLSTGDEASWGNYGLKDQAVAVQWVNENIESFNGDPDKVTLFGHGAGGASSSYHAIYNMTKGMFKRYISASGNANCIWAFEEKVNASQRARDLAGLLNCNTNDSHPIVDCLRNADVKSLVDSDSIFYNNPNRTILYELGTWKPTEEKQNHKDSFIDMYPVKRLLSFPTDQISGIIGSVKDEGLYYTAELYKNQSLFDSMYNDRRDYVQYTLDSLFDEKDAHKHYVDETMKNYFSGGRPLTKQEFINQMTSLLSDVAFRYPGLQQFNLIIDDGSSADVFVYELDYRGSYSTTSDTIGTNEDIGVTHGDDMRLFFPMKKSGAPQLSDSDEKMSDFMLDLWTSFAITGKPTSQALPDPDFWKDYIRSYGDGLKIGENSDPTSAYMVLAMDEDMQNWASLINSRIYQSYNDAYDAVK